MLARLPFLGCPVKQGQSEKNVGESIGKIVGEFIFCLKIPCNNFEV
jgi:hypothetical protein